MLFRVGGEDTTVNKIKSLLLWSFHSSSGKMKTTNTQINRYVRYNECYEEKEKARQLRMMMANVQMESGKLSPMKLHLTKYVRQKS